MVPARLARAGHFLKGPIPLEWLCTAARLPGRALHVGVLVWFRAGLTRSDTVHLPSALLAACGIDRDAKARALRALERAGLVTVRRSHGRAPDITLVMGPLAAASNPTPAPNAGKES